MFHGVTCTIISNSTQDTERLGQEIGERLQGGEVIELIGDLGSGKTAFVRGLARGFGSNDHVASPTFTINRQYSAGKKKLYHFDFYRLTEVGSIAHELEEVIIDPAATVVIEWGAIAKDVLPEHRLQIYLLPLSESSRKLDIKSPQTLSYLINEEMTC